MLAVKFLIIDVFDASDELVPVANLGADAEVEFQFVVENVRGGFGVGVWSTDQKGGSSVVSTAARAVKEPVVAEAGRSRVTVQLRVRP